jgi:hypothetical protein
MRDRLGRPVLTEADAGKLDQAPDGTLCVFCKGEPYNLTVLPPGGECLIQYRVSRPGKARSYTVTVELDGSLVCDCADWTFRRHQIDPLSCKHARAIRDSGLINLTWR